MRLQRARLCIAAAAVCMLGGPLSAQDGLPTLQEATVISKKTGRPILAMAGQKT